MVRVQRHVLVKVEGGRCYSSRCAEAPSRRLIGVTHGLTAGWVLLFWLPRWSEEGPCVLLWLPEVERREIAYWRLTSSPPFGRGGSRRIRCGWCRNTRLQSPPDAPNLTRSTPSRSPSPTRPLLLLQMSTPVHPFIGHVNASSRHSE